MSGEKWPFLEVGDNGTCGFEFELLLRKIRKP